MSDGQSNLPADVFVFLTKAINNLTQTIDTLRKTIDNLVEALDDTRRSD